MRRRRRVTGRFYIFLLVLIAIVFGIVYLSLPGGEAVIMLANAQYSQVMDCVIVRDEEVTVSDSTARIEYIGAENTLVSAGDTIAYVYTAGYSENLLTKLEKTRSDIQTYHKDVILSNIKDANLSRYDTIVDMMMLEFKHLVNHETRGSLLTASRQLETAMVNRQEYLRQNKREDTKLTKLYDEENTRMAGIQSWRQVQPALGSGVLSFYMDGYESTLNANTLSSLRVSDIRSVLAGQPLGQAGSKKSSPVFRIVNQDLWYVAIIANAQQWNPVVGQQYSLQMQGFEDLVFNASVESVQKESGTLLVVFEIRDPIGPMIYQRTGRAKLSITLSGLSVTSKAICEQNGQTGIRRHDLSSASGVTFVPVEVLSDDGTTALIQPLVEGSVREGELVLTD